MALTPGTRIGSYEITALIGVGGMGEVYRATDTNLARQVAIKVLPDAVASDAGRLARFDREAKTLAALNHPNIAHIYGVERSERQTALVMELIEGPTLADRITQGPIPVDEALAIAQQIAEALEAAHEQGIIHRDLKPANIKLRPDGTGKVLDFGLAKAMDTVGATSSGLSQSPTITTPAMTRAGLILGTAAYMSPEQARGDPIDQRADVWAFGVVLFEMLSGRRLFNERGVSETLAAVLKTEPDWTALPADVPRPLVRLLRRCLVKDRRNRLHAIADARLDLAVVRTDEIEAASVAESGPWRQPSVWGVVLATAAVAVVATWLAVGRGVVPTPSVTRFSIVLPEGQLATSRPAVSRDGRLIAYAAARPPDLPALYVWSLEQGEARRVDGSDGASAPFFSPDGAWVGFFANGRLFRVSVSGGAPTAVASAPVPFGGTWLEDGTIIFTPQLNAGLARVSVNGGAVESLTDPDGAGLGFAHVYPSILPDEEHVLFTIWGGEGSTRNVIMTLATGELETVFDGSFTGRALASDHLLAGDAAAELLAAPFDLTRLRPTVPQAPVATDVYFLPQDSAPFADVSRTGTLAYVWGNPARRTLVWVGRDDGTIDPVNDVAGVYAGLSLSSDGTRLAYTLGWDVWTEDLERGTRSRATFEFPASQAFLGAWRPSGDVAFSANRSGDWELYTVPADGTSPPALALERAYTQHVSSVSSDGVVAFVDFDPEGGSDLWALAPGGEPEPLATTPFQERQGVFSPDGRFLAYVSNESGRDEVYVRPYPGQGRVTVSNAGGTDPVWSPRGDELFYRQGTDLMAVQVRTTPAFDIGGRQRLLDASGFVWRGPEPLLAVSPDARRFLMIREPAGSRRRIEVVLNWFEELERLVPAG